MDWFRRGRTGSRRRGLGPTYLSAGARDDGLHLAPEEAHLLWRRHPRRGRHFLQRLGQLAESQGAGLLQKGWPPLQGGRLVGGGGRETDNETASRGCAAQRGARRCGARLDGVYLVVWEKLAVLQPPFGVRY